MTLSLGAFLTISITYLSCIPFLSYFSDIAVLDALLAVIEQLFHVRDVWSNFFG